MAGQLNNAQRISLSAIGPKQVAEDALDATSYLGTPVYGQIIIPSQTYTNLQGDDIETEEIIINTALINVTQANEVVTTSIQGRPGTIKEYINLKDYSITINAQIDTGQIDNIREYPVEKLRILGEICRSTAEFNIDSQILNDIFGITDVVFLTLKVPQQEGVMNVVPVQITAISEPESSVRVILEE